MNYPENQSGSEVSRREVFGPYTALGDTSLNVGRSAALGN